MHPFGRFPERSHKDLVRVAAVRALADADLGTRDVQAVFSANAMGGVLQGQEQIRGQSALREIGIEGVPIVNVENACASGSTALHQAVLAIRAGAVDVALVVGFEKMFVGDRERSLAALESAADLDVVAGLGLQFTAVYALKVQRAVSAGRLTADSLVAVAAKSHANGALNPFAQFRKGLTADDIRKSPMISDPLTLMMCSAITDGAAALVVARQGHVRARVPVSVRASRLSSGYTRTSDADPWMAELCARAAYEEAGLGPSDIDVAEVHDAAAPGELLYYEQLGFCAAGEASQLLSSGATAIGGRIAVNPSGGLVARGHATGATGVAQLVELVWQLRGEAGARQTGQPRLALAQNSGGWYEGDSAACNVHILERSPAWT
jgi:acetyl-CoA acetyltransferase